MLDAKSGERVTKTWAPIDAAAGDAIDWWPDDAPVVLGEIDGGERVTTRHRALASRATACSLRVVAP